VLNIRIPAYKRRKMRGIGTGCAVLASQYIHPEFGFFCSTPRFRRRLRLVLACLVVAGVGAAVMARSDRPELDAAVTRVDTASIVETVPATSLTPFASLSSSRAVVEGASPASDKPRCVGDALADLDGNCVSIKLRKPRMVGLNGFAVGRRPSPGRMIGGICSRAGKEFRLDGSNKG
jgi:hypothetical protein